MPSDLNDFARALDIAAEANRRKHEEFQRALGAPIMFIPSPDDPEQGIGWFRGDVGFFSYVKYHNGYDPNTRHILTDSLIRALMPYMPPVVVRVRQRP